MHAIESVRGKDSTTEEPGVVIRRDGEANARFEQAPRRGLGYTEVERTTGKKATDDRGLREGFDPAFVDVLEVLSRDGADLRCQTGSSHLRDLIGVDLRNESMLFAFFEHATGLLEGEGRVFAEHVAEYREAFLRDAPHELVAHHEVDIGLAAITIFRAPVYAQPNRSRRARSAEARSTAAPFRAS